MKDYLKGKDWKLLCGKREKFYERNEKLLIFRKLEEEGKDTLRITPKV